MSLPLLFSLMLVSSDSGERRFQIATEPPQLRTDAPPKEWKPEEINEGLPYRWEKGTVHILAWELIEERSDKMTWRTTQILVLKRFDRPTEKGKYRWLLAQLYHRPEDKRWPWRREMLHFPPPPPGKKMPRLTDAQVFGHEFFHDLPTDGQIALLLREAGWTPRIGPGKAFTIPDDKVVAIHYMTVVAKGGVNRSLWKNLFGRDVPTKLFPELKKGFGG